MSTPIATPSTGRLAERLLGSRVADALAGPHDVDHYLELLRPDWAVRKIRAEIVDVRHQTPDSVTLTLRPTVTWPGFRAGQHVELAVDVDGRRHRRSYSPSGSADVRTRTVELTVRTHPEGVVSRHLKAHARPGMVVGLSRPQGEDFVLPDVRPRRIALISGGSGITPVLSMLRTLTDEGHTGEITFLHYARSPEDLLYAGDLHRIAERHPNVTLLRCYTRSGDGELTGRLGEEHLRRALPVDEDAAAFVCGPGALVEAVRTAWRELDLRTPLKFEHFAPPELPELDPDQLGAVTFARAGTTVDATGDTLLEQAEAAGLSPKHGCRMGICMTCACRLEHGRVRNTLDGEIHGAPGDEIRICVSAPVGDVTVDV
ncbi:ferredoxin reductase [Patulibacter sp. SYSU D01012]|uniref:ferredoxin reductase n=1 Tax=Patulibacter sp. SYSU D01012 TaxID=2817381 RepID=UPI001B301913|nr:ferredoxin reductase [Patulibacter sp. SYSU D01012]